MRILVVGIDSDIGAEIAKLHKEDGDDIVTTSRNGKGTHTVELSHPFTWPKFKEKEFDKIYYTIGIGDQRSSRMEVMQVNAFITCDFLNAIAYSAKDNCKIVVLSSEWGSIKRIKSMRAAAYRMSKAALNMGVAIAAQRHQRLNWILMHPGLVKTKMTEWLSRNATETVLSPTESASGIITASKNCADQFCFIDYNGEAVPF